jgi:hypothetical protein
MCCAFIQNLNHLLYDAFTSQIPATHTNPLLICTHPHLTQHVASDQQLQAPLLSHHYSKAICAVKLLHNGSCCNFTLSHLAPPLELPAWQQQGTLHWLPVQTPLLLQQHQQPVLPRLSCIAQRVRPLLRWQQPCRPASAAASMAVASDA